MPFQQPRAFQIRFIKRVVFKDCKGNELKEYNIGDVVEATGIQSTYYVTPMGGIFKDEVEIV